MSATAKTLKLVQTTPKKRASAPRLRAGIIEGTGGKDSGPYPPLSVDVQRTIDRKARSLADEACNLIRESLVRDIGYRCFFGRSYEGFDEEKALQLIADADLDTALAPFVRERLDRVRNSAEFLLHNAKETLGKIDSEMRRFNRAREEGGAA